MLLVLPTLKKKKKKQLGRYEYKVDSSRLTRFLGGQNQPLDGILLLLLLRLQGSYFGWLRGTHSYVMISGVAKSDGNRAVEWWKRAWANSTLKPLVERPSRGSPLGDSGHSNDFSWMEEDARHVSGNNNNNNNNKSMGRGGKGNVGEIVVMPSPHLTLPNN
jgi:hypothetical protein